MNTETMKRDRPETIAVIDPDVHLVLEFMQRNLQCSRMVSVAEAVAKLAPILWGHYDAEGLAPLTLALPKPRPLQSTASESSLELRCVDDDSVAVRGGL